MNPTTNSISWEIDKDVANPIVEAMNGEEWLKQVGCAVCTLTPFNLLPGGFVSFPMSRLVWNGTLGL